MERGVGGHRELPVTITAFVESNTYIGTLQLPDILTLAMWTNRAVRPDDRFKERPTTFFIGKGAT
jgi:hypothetical protein